MLATQLTLNIPPQNEDLIQQFHYDIYEMFCEYVPAIANHKYEDAVEIIQHLYHVWIDSNKLSQCLSSKDLSSFASMFVALMTFTLAAELSWITHYSLQTAFGLTALTISVGIRITTPSYISVGLLANGFFKYRVVRRQGCIKTRMIGASRIN